MAVYEDETFTAIVQSTYPTDEDELIEQTETESQPKFKTYKRRWYVLGVFMFVSLTVSFVAFTFNTISETAQCAFGWTSWQMALQQIWLSSTFLVTIVPLLWFVNSKGLRLSVVFCVLLIVTSTSMRSITMTPPYITWIANLSQILIGFTQPIIFALPPLVSVTWFPPRERATATGIAATSGILGSAISFKLCPQIIQLYKPENSTSTNSYGIESTVSSIAEECSAIMNSTIILQERWEIHKLMFIELGLCGVLLLVTLVYFPARPPLPPSQSASSSRMGFKKGFFQLIKNGNIWLISFAFGLSCVFGTWTSMIEVLLEDKLPQSQSGNVAFCSMVCGCTASFVSGRCADKFYGHLKKTTIVLLTLAVIGALWTTLLVEGYVTFTVVQIYLSVTLVAVVVIGSTPLFFELVCEVAYPVSEVLSSTLMASVYSLVNMTFLLIPKLIPHGREMINWVMFGSMVASLPLIMLAKAKYNRLNLDNRSDNTDDSITTPNGTIQDR